MLGIGDNLFQRAVLRDLLRTRSVHLGSWYSAMYHDLIPQGLRLGQFSGRKERIREDQPLYNAPAPHSSKLRLTYSAEAIRRYGSILAAMYAASSLKMPERPDFSLPVPETWREKARRLVGPHDKPLLIYRPIVLNKVWHAPLRAPDPESYAALFAAIREHFFVVSVADLNQQEWIVGDAGAPDLTFHNGELSFEALAGLFAEASLVFSNPGFAPVLAQAVGTPVVIVYGGNECYRTTNAVGAHLAATLAIEPKRPCDCHVGKGECRRGCDKRIDVAAALPRLSDFVQNVLVRGGVESRHAVGPAKGLSVPPGRIDTVNGSGSAGVAPGPRILIFGTCYIDSEHRRLLLQRWIDLHTRLNPDCEFLLVDSASPVPPPNSLKAPVWSFVDNIGHLSRGGRDGWGRAFSQGLHIAIREGYDYVVHIEGDSLCRLNVADIVADMQARKIDVATIPVEGTKRKEVGWVETGLMFFRVGYLKDSGFIDRYDWPNRQVRPTPERVIFDLLGTHLTMMAWRGERGDKSQITPENVGALDWVTHCWDRDAVYDAFVNDVVQPEKVKLNLGCGTNRLPGWANYDAEIDITRPLPFVDGWADCIFAEHVVEHVTQYQALAFLRECRRVLKPGGVVRIAVPALDRIWKNGNQDYFDFARKWAPTADRRGAMHAIAHAHGHQALWTRDLLEAALYLAGFDRTEACAIGQSAHPDLVGVEGHGRVIGEAFNSIETVVIEGVK